MVNYKASPTGIKFHASQGLVKAVMGPFGSGKSVMCCWDIFFSSKRQAPGADGIRRSRHVVVRNTYSQLETTTMATWRDWFPEDNPAFGKISGKAPYRQKWKFDDVEAEIIFQALDTPEDAKKLLSLEATKIWFNEAREIPWELIMAALGRTGRYPSAKDKPEGITMSEWTAERGLIMDTNPPDDEHWYFKCAEEEMWAADEEFWPKDADTGEPVDPRSDPRFRWVFLKQPSGLAKDAENIEFLPGGQDYYYQMMVGGQNTEWLDVHVHGKYGYVKKGMPVFEGYWNNDTMVSEKPILVPAGAEMFLGIDCSGRHPASIFAFKNALGRWFIVDEFCVTAREGMGATRYAEALKHKIQSTFPNHSFKIFGDPAGGWKQQNDERTYYDILRGQGIAVRPSPGLRVPERLETVKGVLSRSVQGVPGILVDPKAKTLIRGFNGGYSYKRYSTASGDKYDDKPDKRDNRFSDAQDALQYLFCGAGEMRKMYGRNKHRQGTYQANTGFSVFK